MSGLQRRAFRLDALERVAGLIEREHADPVEADALFLARGRVDDRLAVGAALAHPEAERMVCCMHVLALAEHLGFVAASTTRASPRKAGCRHAVAPIPSRNAAISAGRDELPGGHAGRACDHEFVTPRKRQIAGHRADQHREGEQSFGQVAGTRKNEVFATIQAERFGMSAARRISSM